MSAEPHAIELDLSAGATVLGLAEAVLASGYLPDVHGGATWVLAGGRHQDARAIIDPQGGSVTAVWDDRELRAPYDHHLTVHPGASVDDVRRQVVQGPWDGPGRRPPRTPGTVRIVLERDDVHAGDDPHPRTIDLPAGSRVRDLVERIARGGLPPVAGRACWVLLLGRYDDALRPWDWPTPTPVAVVDTGARVIHWATDPDTALPADAAVQCRYRSSTPVEEVLAETLRESAG